MLTAGASSPANVWAFTSAGRAIRWNGCSWAVVRGLPVRHVSGVAAFGRKDMWLFGPAARAGRPGAWHYDGRRWARSPGGAGLAIASPVTPHDIWASGAGRTSDATVIAHWNGSGWHRSSVAGLLPRPTPYCSPGISAIYAVSAADVWAVGADACQDLPGPAVLLHYTGGTWRRVAKLGAHVPVAVLPDGHGGLWIPVTGEQTLNGRILRYFHGHVSSAALPVQPGQLFLFGATSTVGGSAALAVGRRGLPGGATDAVILQYRR